MKSYTLKELAALTGAQLVGNPDHRILGVENLEAAQSDEAAFLENSRYEKQAESTQAGVIFVTPSLTLLPSKNYLVTDQPSLTFQKVIELFIPQPASAYTGIHPTAVIHPSAQIGEGVSIGPFVVIDQGAIIGARTTLSAHVYVGAETAIGSDCYLHPRVTVRERCQIGNRVTIQPGAVIGSCGFGYHTDPKGKHTFLRQLGRVIVEDDVDIGANTTIDRARFKETRICRGTKIDNLVQIAHQVELGEDNLIVSQVGIAGSSKTGRCVIMGGQVGIAGHLSITDGVMIGAQAGVSKSLQQPGVYQGSPAAPIKEAYTQIAHLRNLGKLIARLKEIEFKIHAFENSDFIKNLTKE